jgi:hypothetical protein
MYLTSQQLDLYEGTIRKTVEWARSRWDSILTEPDLQCHYKAPAFWASVGEPQMAARHCRVIRERFLRDDGDFRMADDVKGFTRFPCTTVNQYIYPNGWLIVGMQKLGAYDVVAKALSFILRFQDPDLGGFYYKFDPKGKRLDQGQHFFSRYRAADDGTFGGGLSSRRLHSAAA